MIIIFFILDRELVHLAHDLDDLSLNLHIEVHVIKVELS